MSIRQRICDEQHFVLATLSGCLYFVAFPPLDHGTVALIALVPLLVALRGQTRSRAFLLGWLAGTVCIYGLVAPSILEASVRFSPAHQWRGWVLALLIPQVYGALYFGVFALCAREIQIRRLGAVAELLAIAAAWTACEFVRSRVGDGCPWVLLAHSQHLRLWMLQIADLGGALAVSFVIALVNVAVAMLIGTGRGSASPDRQLKNPTACFDRLILRQAQESGSPPRAQWTFPLTLSLSKGVRRVFQPANARLQVIGVTLAVLAMVRLYGERQLERWALPSGDAIRVALVQANVPDEWRYSLRRLPETMSRLHALTAQAMTAAPDLVVWPENAVTVSAADNVHLFSGLAGQLQPGARLLVGAPRAVLGGDGRPSLRNAAYLLDAAGRPLDVYDKLRLTPFGETLPLPVRALVADRGSSEGGYVAGDRFTTFEVAGHRFAAVICYEAIYAELVRQFVGAGAEFLVNISNDGWFGAQPSLEQHFYAVLFRAVESRRFLVRATNAGITAVIDPRGIVLSTAPRAETTVLAATITANAAQTLYTRTGDVLGWLCLVAVGVVICLPVGRKAG